MRSNPDWMLPLITVPLFVIIFLIIFIASGRSDLASFAILAPALIGLWAQSLFCAGELVTSERDNGSLELLLSSTSSLAVVMFGRVSTIVLVASLGFVEAWAMGWLITGEILHIHHPGVFAVTILMTLLGMGAVSVSMAALFVLARSARTFQNALSYPFYLLGGVLVPLPLMPDWIEILGRFVFLSWASDLLRSSLTSEHIENILPRLLCLAALVVLSLLLGRALMATTLRRVRSTGSLNYA